MTITEYEDMRDNYQRCREALALCLEALATFDLVKVKRAEEAALPLLPPQLPGVVR